MDTEYDNHADMRIDEHRMRKEGVGAGGRTNALKNFACEAVRGGQKFIKF